MRTFIFYFVASFLLQVIWFGLIHPHKGVTLLDMFMFSILFVALFFLIDRVLPFLKKGKA